MPIDWERPIVEAVIRLVIQWIMMRMIRLVTQELSGRKGAQGNNNPETRSATKITRVLQGGSRLPRPPDRGVRRRRHGSRRT